MQYISYCVAKSIWIPAIKKKKKKEILSCWNVFGLWWNTESLYLFIDTIRLIHGQFLPRNLCKVIVLIIEGERCLESQVLFDKGRCCFWYIFTFLNHFWVRYYFLVKCIFWWVMVSASFWSFVNVKQCFHKRLKWRIIFFISIFYWYLLMKECCLSVEHHWLWAACHLACFCIYFLPLHANLSVLCLYQSATGHSCKWHLYMGFSAALCCELFQSVYLIYVLPFKCDRA